MKRTTVGPVVYDHGEEKIDEECRSICDAINALPGLETISSCCGHGYARFRAYFVADELNDLKPILSAIDESEKWIMRASMSVSNMEIYFVLEGWTGEAAYRDANLLAKLMKAITKEQS